MNENNNNNKKVVIAVWVLLIAIILIILAIVLNLGKDEKNPVSGTYFGTESMEQSGDDVLGSSENTKTSESQNSTNNVSGNQGNGNQGNNSQVNATVDNSGNANVSSESKKETDNSGNSNNDGDNDHSGNDSNVGGDEGIDSSESSTEDSSETSTEAIREPEPPKPGNAEIIDRADASYEEWLAAGMVIGVSMRYMEGFELEGIYLTGETTLEDKASSNGVHVVFSSGGQTYVVSSKALETERTASGTLDLFTKDLGFNTFDVKTTKDFDTYGMTSVTIEDLSELIDQSILVTIYEH